MRVDRGKLVFLGVVTALAVGLVLLIAELPKDWQSVAILWVLIGLPFLFAVLRVWRGYVQLQLEAMARAPQQQPPAGLGGAGEGDRRELKVVEVSKADHGRRML
jgi:hypothetical protein